MAQINKVEIICKPCSNCENLKRLTKAILQSISNQQKIKVSCEIKHYESTKDILEASTKYNISMKQFPIMLINGEMAFIGHVNGENVIRMKFEEILRS